VHSADCDAGHGSEGCSGCQQLQDEEVEYDDEGNMIVKKRKIEVLPPLNHLLINYIPFCKDFYR
jgi:hypothetical protein